MNFLCGPIASSLCQRYGCRLVASVGGLIGVLGLLLTSFTENIYVIYLTYSVLWGFGSSMNYAPTLLVLGKLLIEIRWLQGNTNGILSKKLILCLRYNKN